MGKVSMDNATSLNVFIPRVQNASRDFFKVINLLVKGDYAPPKTFYSHLITEADRLEIFLDDHGGRANRAWVFFRELVASIRNFGIVAFQLKHTIDRFLVYPIKETKEEIQSFSADAEETMNFLNRYLIILMKEIKEEARRLGLSIPTNECSRADFEEIDSEVMLPNDLAGEVVATKDIEDRLIEISRRFRKVYKIFWEEGLGRKCDKEKVLKLMPFKINEKKLRKLEQIIHGIQSEYDTFIRNTEIEKEHPSFQSLRGYVSVTLHLLEAAVWVSHFCLRHEDLIRRGRVTKKIANLIDKTEVLNMMANFFLYYANQYLEKGNEFAENIMTFYIIKVCYALPIPKPQGFHARPATYVSLIVNEHGSDVFIVVDDDRFNAKSVLSILEAGWKISEKGYDAVHFEGDKRTLDDLKVLANHNYCEEEDIPRELNYLRILRNL